MHGTRNQSKISGGGGGLVQFSYFMYVTCCRFALFKTFMPCFRWFQIVCEWLQMFLRWLQVVVEIFEVVVGGFRWFQVVLGRSMFQYANEHHPTIKFIVEISVSEATLLETSIYKGERFNRESVLDIRARPPTERFQDTFTTQRVIHQEQREDLLKAKSVTTPQDYFFSRIFEEKNFG